MSNFLFELYLEEVPHGILPVTACYFQTKLPELLKQQGLSYRHIDFFFTPRRLSFLIYDLPDQGSDKVIEQKGPSLKVAYDEQGNPTRALKGFLNTYSCTEKDLEKRDIKDQIYLFINKIEKGLVLQEILPAMLDELIQGIRFPQPMRWNHNEAVYEFIRPVRGITALIDSTILDVEFFGLKSSNIIKGHRQLFPKSIVLNNADAYQATLKRNGCIPSFEERCTLITKAVSDIGVSLDGTPLLDDELLNILASLTEFPHPLKAEFDPKFLSLPKEVLISEMKIHQKYIPIINKNGDLMPYYIITANIPHTDPQTKSNILAGNDRVLTARFSDGRFFFEEDLKKGLEFYSQSLYSVAFVDGAGSMGDKVERIKKIAEYLRGILAPDVSSAKLMQATDLAKADLCSLMVGEFPELQGVIGAYYAEALKVDPQVSLAVKEHYYPLNEDIPTQTLSALLGISDRIDNLFVLYAVGKTVTGSKDPYALRRQTIALIHLITLFQWKEFSLSGLFEHIGSLYQNILTVPKEDWQKTITEFIQMRLEGILKASPYELQADVVNAVLYNKIDVLLDDIRRAEALQNVRRNHTERFASIIELSKRINNILKDEPVSSFKEKLLTEDAEKSLYRHFIKISEQTMTLDYYDALSVLVQLETSITVFFDSVMVKTGDEKESNRLALLNFISGLLKQYADFSKLS